MTIIFPTVETFKRILSMCEIPDEQKDVDFAWRLPGVIPRTGQMSVEGGWPAAQSSHTQGPQSVPTSLLSKSCQPLLTLEPLPTLGFSGLSGKVRKVVFP